MVSLCSFWCAVAPLLASGVVAPCTSWCVLAPLLASGVVPAVVILVRFGAPSAARATTGGQRPSCSTRATAHDSHHGDRARRHSRIKGLTWEALRRYAAWSLSSGQRSLPAPPTPAAVLVTRSAPSAPKAPSTSFCSTSENSRYATSLEGVYASWLPIGKNAFTE